MTNRPVLGVCLSEPLQTAWGGAQTYLPEDNDMKSNHFQTCDWWNVQAYPEEYILPCEKEVDFSILLRICISVTLNCMIIGLKYIFICN